MGKKMEKTGLMPHQLSPVTGDSNVKILIVEDEELVRKVIEDALVNQGYDTVESASGFEEGIEKALTNHPDLIIMDINLGSAFSGIEAVKEIHKHLDAAVIYLTGLSDKDSLAKIFETKPHGYLTKPFCLIELSVTIRIAIKNLNMERALKKSEEKYRKIFEDSKDMIFIATLAGNIIDINHSGIELLGYSSKEEMLNVISTSNFFNNEEVKDSIAATIKETGYIKEIELELKKKDGTIVTTLITASSIKNEDGIIHGYIGIIRDITFRVQHERLMLQMNAELLDANEKLKRTQVTMIQQEKLASIGQLAAGVAHELNNPIGFIYSNVNTLEKYFKSIASYISLVDDFLSDIKIEDDLKTKKLEELSQYRQSKQLDYLFGDILDIFKESNEGFDRITSIVESLRRFSRVDRLDTLEDYDIEQAIDSTLKVANNEIKYVAEVEKNFSGVPSIKCKGSEINQVLLNILINAAHAIKSQNREDRGKIVIKTCYDEEQIFCTISDNGPGIPESIIGKIFDPFFTTKESGQGTGLGLNIAYDIIVNKHHGELIVESVEGKGTTFIITLPMQPQERKDSDKWERLTKDLPCKKNNKEPGVQNEFSNFSPGKPSGGKRYE